MTEWPFSQCTSISKTLNVPKVSRLKVHQVFCTEQRSLRASFGVIEFFSNCFLKSEELGRLRLALLNRKERKQEMYGSTYLFFKRKTVNTVLWEEISACLVHKQNVPWVQESRPRKRGAFISCRTGYDVLVSGSFVYGWRFAHQLRDKACALSHSFHWLP